MTRHIALTRGLVALVDDNDFDWLSQWKWQALPVGRKFYAKRRGSLVKGDATLTVAMHRAIVRPPDEYDVDHINGDGLDNRRANLRIVTTSQNLANRPKFSSNKSGFKGVVKQGDRWRMQFSLEFDSAEEAARAYDKIARLFFGEHARTNFKND